MSFRHVAHHDNSPPSPGNSVEFSTFHSSAQPTSPDRGSRENLFSNTIVGGEGGGDRDPVSRQNAVMLSRSQGYVITSSIWDFVLAAVPIAFIVIAVLAASLDGDKKSKRGDQIMEVTSLIPTVFPIVFAALVGYFFRVYGTFRAERGVRLGTLEQLIGSHSFFSAFERQMLLRDFGFLGILIMIIWALSPIGGQAGLRLLTRTMESVPYNSTNWYLSPASLRDSALGSASSMNTAGDLITSIYTSSLMASKTTGGTGMDLWGNAKIPDIKTLKDAGKPDDWRMVNWSDPVQFTSLLGIPVGRPMSQGNMTFTVSSQYFDVQCSENIPVEKKDLKRLSYGLVNETSGLGHSMLLYFASPLPKTTDEVGGETSSRAKFMFGSRTEINDNYTWGISDCTLGNLAVDSRIECESKTCKVAAMRPAKRVDNSKDLNHLVNNTLRYLTTATDRAKSTNHLYSSTLTERWMNATELLFEGGRIDMDLWKLKPDVLSARLGVTLNTYWQASFATKFRGTPLPETTAFYEEHSNCSPDVFPQWCFVPTETSGVRHTGVIYRCNRAWLAVFMVISIVLQLLALASFVLKRITLAPDILGYVSSYTRDNPHAPLAETAGSFHDGLARTRLLKDVKVMLGDVKAAERVGHISFVAQGDAPVGRLTKGRSYI
ncbi:hypothetical protein AJ79_03621 [Helicocarpus griseus UAMH5409]|uniref:Uncharacterized protein n=1 Tax=Helicocarpus griseus UAMH5409 TaxID=1447875 RepID=A0A2B7XXJ4_9EURO|nr:hypothetical protein AJ79_03621 [Helicocarpus griseus UAMH5409]